MAVNESDNDLAATHPYVTTGRFVSLKMSSDWAKALGLIVGEPGNTVVEEV